MNGAKHPGLQGLAWRVAALQRVLPVASTSLMTTAGQELPMGSGRYWLGNHCLRQAMRMTTSPNLVAQVQTTFTERTMMKKGQRSALGHCIEGAPGRAS
jgi:hypothetical protein